MHLFHLLAYMASYEYFASCAYIYEAGAHIYWNCFPKIACLSMHVCLYVFCLSCEQTACMQEIKACIKLLTR